MGAIEHLEEPPELGRIRHALFDFDGTISLIREGWPEVMAPVMLEAICGSQPPTPEIRRAVDDYIDESTGIETILQMEHLVEMVREFGLVAQTGILDAQGYKAIYVGRLRQCIRHHIEGLERGDIDPETLRVPGAIALLQAVAACGVEIYVVSGTDREDVRREAGLLGLTELAGGRVFGALRTYEEFSKASFIQQLFDEYHLSGPELLVVGDGPVEIRLGRQAGAVTLGVAADPSRNGTVNRDRRERLVRAGAHAIVPDMRASPEIIGWLFPEASV